MPSKNNSDFLAKSASIVGICAGTLVILGSIFAWISGIAWASDVEALSKKHDSDFIALQIVIYQKDIDALTLKPNKTQYDRDLLQLYKNRIAQIK